MTVLMRDIVDVPVVETVVRLDDAADTGKRGSVVSDFVITRQVERNLSLVAQAVKDGRGRGYFLVGPYGSGKSHFLSYLSLILSGEISAGGSCPIGKILAGRRFMPVRVSLVDVRSDRRIEDVLLEAAERRIHSAGADICLSRRSKFLRYIEDVIRPVSSSGMDAYLAASGLPAWEVLREDGDKAVHAAWGYMKTLSDCPSMPDHSPSGLIAEVMTSAKQLGYDGVVVVIDELSEFLRSKQSKAQLNEDARYLQLIGEFARSGSFIVVASLQEAIEQTGDIARDVVGKIKDRYPVRLSLDEQHIRGLIDGRLIRKKEGARDRIREIWLKFTETLPMFQIDFEDFYRIYPVHPATIRYLEGLSPLLSAHRGVVDFIVSCVKGDPGRGTKGLLDASASELVTTDMIYEHFRERIREDGRFQEFDTVVRRDIDRSIGAVLKEEGDRILARRACDVLILNEIADLEKPKSISELVSILASSVTGVSRSANEQYLADVVLGPVQKESLYLRTSHAESAGSRVFRVSLERDSGSLFQKEVQRILSSVAPDDSRVVQSVLSAVSADLPVSDVLNGLVVEMVVPWRGSRRRGGVMWSGIFSAAEVEQKIGGLKYDFAVVLCPPGFKSTESFPERAVVWIPEFNSDEISEMQRFYCAVVLAGDESVERAVREEAKSGLDGMKSRMSAVVESGYKNGRILVEGREAGCEALFGATGFVERYTSQPVIEMLKRRHPRYLDVAPEVEFVSRRMLTPLIDAIIVPGKISMAAARKNNSRTMIEGVLIPMGLASVRGPSFCVQADPSKSNLIRGVMDMVSDGCTMSGLSDYLIRGEYGLPEELSDLLVIVMVHSGLIELRKNGRRIPSGIVNFSNVGDAEEVSSGELLSADCRNRLFADRYLSEGIDEGAFSLSSQRAVWERLRAARDSLKQYVAETLPALSAVSRYPVFDGFDFSKVRSAVEKGLEAVESVEWSKGAASGLGRYLSEERPDLGDVLNLAGAVEKFVSDDSDRLIRIADYLRETDGIKEMPDEIAGLLGELKELLSNLTDIVLQQKTADIFSAFDSFLTIYSKWYVEKHSMAFADGKFMPLSRLRETKEWRALSQIGTISSVHIVDDANAISRRINGSLSLRCERSPSADLRLKPVCGCGFLPGSRIEIEDAREIKAAIENGLGEACGVLSDAKVLEKLISRVSALRDIDLLKASSLEEIFHRLRDGITTVDLVRIMTPEVAALLNEALERKVTVVRRDVRGLSSRLIGRRLPPERVTSIFNEWLGDCGDGEVVVDLGSDESRDAASPDAELAGWIKDHCLDEAKARLSLVVPGSVEPQPEPGEFTVDDARFGRMVDLTGLANAGGDKIIELIGRERRSRRFALETVRRLMLLLIDGFVPLEGKEVYCHFDDIQMLCNAAVSAVRPFSDAEFCLMMGREAGREYAMSFLDERHICTGFPSQQTIGRLHDVMKRQISLRDQMFAALPQWPVSFNSLIGDNPGGVFVFIDAARWDMVVKLKEFIRGRLDGISLLDEKWFRTHGVSTASWQEAVFGTSDLDSISATLKNSGVRYFADAERSDVRMLIKEEDNSGEVWLRIGLVDRLIHATSLPFCRLFDDTVSELCDLVVDIAGLVRDGRRLVILTDHGFSERDDASVTRYCHDRTNSSDSLAAMLVFGRETA